PAAVDVEQHARLGTADTPLAVDSALALLGHQARSLQRLFDPRIAQVNPVLLYQLLVKMAHVQVVILLPIERQYLLHHRQGHSALTRQAPPPVQKTVITKVFVTPSQSAQMSRCQSRYLGRL